MSATRIYILLTIRIFYYLFNKSLVFLTYELIVMQIIITINNKKKN